MSYLLDTNVLSALTKPRKNAGVLDWLATTRGGQHYVSVLTIGELRRGVARLRHRGDHEQADVLEQAVRDTEVRFAARIQSVTVEIVREWARQPPVRPIPAIDGLIAATAAVHGWTVVTRNVADFEPTGVRVLNPFS